ncbi:MAG: hypothetical protein ABI416_01495 [Ginsengibacter sp.]
MKAKLLKHYILVLTVMSTGMTIYAQEKNPETGPVQYHTSNITTRDASGRSKESIETYKDGKKYRFDLINDKVTDLTVDGVAIPAGKYSQYDGVINGIRQQIKEDKIQAHRDQEQAQIDQVRAKNDQKQALQDQARAKLDQDQARKEQARAKHQQDRVVRDETETKIQREQAEKDMEQSKMDQEQAEKDQATAKLNQEQAEKGEVNAKLGQEQAEKDRAHSKIDRQQAEEDERLMKNMISDLISGGIIKDEKSLISLTLNETGMTVNDTKQPDAVFTRFKEKYRRFSTGNFSYSSKEKGYHGIHMMRQTK